MATLLVLGGGAYWLMAHGKPAAGIGLTAPASPALTTQTVTAAASAGAASSPAGTEPAASSLPQGVPASTPDAVGAAQAVVAAASSGANPAVITPALPAASASASVSEPVDGSVTPSVAVVKPRVAASKPKPIAPAPLPKITFTQVGPQTPAFKPAPQAPPPQVIQQAAPVATSPEAACGSRVFLALSMCISRQCTTPQFTSHPQCVALRKQNQQRSETEDLR